MNGIHDMGGMHGFGPVQRGENEPVFHAPWEGRLFGIRLATGPHELFPPQGGLRAALENMDPARYLASSYYERWLLVLEEALLGKGLVTVEELDARTGFFREHPEERPARHADPELAERLVRQLRTSQSPHQDVGVAPRFGVGDAVRVRNINPPGHTRLPRYVRGKHGAIARVHGAHPFQDAVPPGTEIHRPQAVYNVGFDIRELWGDSAEANESLYIDMWESYLEPG